MRRSSVLFSVFRFLLPPAVICLLLLYFYPFFTDCHFPPVKPAEAACLIPGSEKASVPEKPAPFRLLTLADPQLEGDTSLPDPNAPVFPSLQRLKQDATIETLWTTVKEVATNDLPHLFQAYRKRLDLLGNDYYLAHIYRSVNWWTAPTHVVVLGDLLGSQWIGDEEFDRRADRFWHRVFRGAEIVPSQVTGVSGRQEQLGQDDRWKNWLIAVAGNHDIGYAGDVDHERISRFERRFGRVNWEIQFSVDDKASGPLASSPLLRLIILNSMNLDEPVYNADLRQESLDFMEQTLTQSTANTGTILLTHIPLHKEAGICVDEPLINLFPPNQGGGIREQNHLRPETTQHILDLLGSQSLILNGHDHEGCDTFHELNATEGQRWIAKPWRRQDPATGIREVTVRSMMGSFGGNAGLTSAWYDEEEGWQFRYAACTVGVQHIWWAVHILALVEVLLAVGGVILKLLEASNGTVHKQKSKRE